MADRDPMTAVEAELQGERASALGEAGRKIERGLAALEAAQAAEGRPAASAALQAELVDDLAYAVWNYIIIREGLGMYDHERTLAHWSIPTRVMARVGVMKPTR